MGPQVEGAAGLAGAAGEAVEHRPLGDPLRLEDGEGVVPRLAAVDDKWKVVLVSQGDEDLLVTKGLGELTAALAANDRARATFEGFSPSHRREYVEWITEARSEVTRAKRLEQAVEWMSEGKSRHWKYVRK